MVDAAIRGWILILAGAALTVFAARRTRRDPPRAAAAESWGERLCGIMLMIEGGATHLQRFGGAGAAWMQWLALAAGVAGATLVWTGRVRRSAHLRDQAS
jgi:hypothetical protein